MQDLVRLGLSPEWQHSVNEWLTTRHPVDGDWIWRQLLSTMGWQRPELTIFFKMPTGETTTMRVHSAWTVAGLESLLEVLHRQGPPGTGRLINAGRRLEPRMSLSETQVQNESTIHITMLLRGD